MIKHLRHPLTLYVIAALYSCSKPVVEAVVATGVHSDTTVILANNIPDINTEVVPDTRNITTGTLIYRDGYVDQPYIAQFPDSTWACFFTTAKTFEGDNGQHIMMSSSANLGKTWGKPTDVEPATGPIASWAIPYVTSYGRLYVFYAYNGDNITTLNGVAIRHDMLGWYCYKYSDDEGHTWSNRYRIPIKNTSLDNNNDFKGKVQMFWGICKPLHTSNGILFSYTKIGQFLISKDEGWLINCPNIETEKNADSLIWKMLPGDSEVGIKNPAWSIQQEHNIVQLSNGTLYCAMRTDQGFAAFATSSDFGQTWTTPEALRYGNGTASNRVIKNPVACPRIFKCKNGNYILWYENNGTTGYLFRNPAWISGGVEVNGTISWSEPEILLNSSVVSDVISYPDLVEQQGHYFITETQKSIARLHEISGVLLNDLWYQAKRKTKITNGLVAEFTTQTATSGMTNDSLATSFNKIGFTVDFMLKLNSLINTGVVFSDVDTQGNGVKISTASNGTIVISLKSAQGSINWQTDQGSITPNTIHHVAFVVDRSVGIITAMVDGKLCDGGANAQFGWTRFSNINNLSVNNRLVFASALSGQLIDIKFYGRALRTSELVSNYLASE